MKGNSVADIMYMAFVVGGIFVLTKPGGTGATFVKNLGGAGIGLVQASTGQAVTG